MTEATVERLHMPVLALRDVVVYPHMVIPLFVGRAKSIKCLDAAMDNEKQIFLVAQKDATLDDPAGIEQIRQLERRLLELGFVEGARIELLHEGLFGRDPIAMKVDDMRVALRRREAARLIVRMEPVFDTVEAPARANAVWKQLLAEAEDPGLEPAEPVGGEIGRQAQRDPPRPLPGEPALVGGGVDRQARPRSAHQPASSTTRRASSSTRRPLTVRWRSSLPAPV